VRFGRPEPGGELGALPAWSRSDLDLDEVALRRQWAGQLAAGHDVLTAAVDGDAAPP
jgi:hypothetical protein